MPWLFVSLALAGAPELDVGSILAADARGDLHEQPIPDSLAAQAKLLGELVTWDARTWDAENLSLKALGDAAPQLHFDAEVVLPDGPNLAFHLVRSRDDVSVASCDVPDGGPASCTIADAPLDGVAKDIADAIAAAFATPVDGSYPRNRPLVLVPEQFGGPPGIIEVILVPAGGDDEPKVLGGEITYTWSRSTRRIANVQVGAPAQLVPPPPKNGRNGIVIDRRGDGLPQLASISESRIWHLRFFVVTKYGLWLVDQGQLTYLGQPPSP